MTVWVWVGFILLVLALLALDLCVLNRKVHPISTRQALGWTAFWVSLSLIFNACIYFLFEHRLWGIGTGIGPSLTGYQAMMQALTGYIIEWSLSCDNLFVFAVIFSYFQIPMQYQHRVLFWGILGALILRGIMIFVGATLISRFDWILYVFGLLLIATALRLLFLKEKQIEPEKNPLVRLARKFAPVSPHYDGVRFFTRFNGRLMITPMFLVLLVIESTDVLFAVDSIPAVFAVTRNPFIVFTSNVFAIMGLRSLYFVLANMMSQFRYLKTSVIVLLLFVGSKMLLEPFCPISTASSLAIVCFILLTGILLSIWKPGNRISAESSRKNLQ